MQLIVIREGSLLSVSKIYQIDGALYRFLYSDPWVRCDFPRYVFKPLAGQRKRVEKSLTQQGLRRGVFEVVGYSRTVKVEKSYVQMELDL
jgi:hypothetical protein